jgi:hypothetical protein
VADLDDDSFDLFATDNSSRRKGGKVGGEKKPSRKAGTVEGPPMSQQQEIAAQVRQCLAAGGQRSLPRVRFATDVRREDELELAQNAVSILVRNEAVREQAVNIGVSRFSFV